MKSSLSCKISKKAKILAATIIVAAYFLGFAANVYSPSHIGNFAIPIPVLIKSHPGLSSGSSQSADLSPASSPPKIASITAGGSPSFFSHLAITTTYFWVGEPADKDNGYISNKASAWDGQWQNHYGGVDAPSPRNGYLPASFTPKENPFYFALPYNDIDSKGKRKSNAVNCPNAAGKTDYSWCKNSWIAIRYAGKIVYAQWEDVGPFGEDDSAYVFGNSAPSNTTGSAAGLDVSPAVKDYLGLSDVSPTDWVFIRSQDVPAGPWRSIITTDPGDSL